MRVESRRTSPACAARSRRIAGLIEGTCCDHPVAELQTQGGHEAAGVGARRVHVALF